MTNEVATITNLNAMLPEPVRARGIEHAQWMALSKSLFPGAAGESICMVWDYCKARGLDPMKKPCHIVPMRVKDAKTGEYRWRDVVLPGIYELRTTAQRTGQYLGHSEPKYGPMVDLFGVTAPEWCAMTIYRWHAASGQKVEFPVRVYFTEAVGTKTDKKSGEISANDRWAKAPIQMLTKCAEAAGLREAFPDELGGTHTAEEMDGATARSQEAPAATTTSLAEIKRNAAPKPDHAAELGLEPQFDDVDDAEFSEPESHEPPAEAGPPTADELLARIKKATDEDQVAVVMDALRDIQEPERTALKRAAVAKMQELVA